MDDSGQREPADAGFARLGELIGAIEVAFLTTVEPGGRLHTRPVQTLRYEPDGLLWFFTDRHSPKADELRQDARVSLGYADPAHRHYVAVNGMARLLTDPVKAAELWTPVQRAWYPHGPEDERLALLRVQIERAEYWLPPGRAGYMLAVARAIATGEPVEPGENRKFT